MGRKKSWPTKTTVSLRFEQETLNYIEHLKKYLASNRGFFSNKVITNSLVVEQAIGHYFIHKKKEYWSKTQGKSFK